MSQEGPEALLKAYADATARTTPEISASVRQRVLSARARAERRELPPLYRWALGGVALAAAAALAFVLLRPAAPTFQVASSPGEVGAWLNTTPSSELGLRFSEGTSLALANSSRARVTRVTRDGARVELARGSVKAEVTHRPGAAWSFDAGPFEVAVTGTQLQVSWAPEAGKFEVSVASGAVLVKGPLIVGEQRVQGGQVCRVDLNRRVMDLGAIVAEQASAAPASAPAPAADASDLKPTSSATPPPSSAVATPPPSVEALLEEARAARLAGRREQERGLLLAVRQRVKGQGAAAQAAYLLGKGAKAGEAAAWFQTYLREEPHGLLAREAAGRLIESYRAAGDAINAQQAAARYLARYADGPHAAMAKQVLATRSQGQD